MATAEDTRATSSRRLTNNKRRLAREAVLPDVTNLPKVHPDNKVSKGHFLVQKTSCQSSASDFQVPSTGRHGSKESHVTCENQGLPVRAAKIAAKAKLKANIPSFPRRKRQEKQKVSVSDASESDTSFRDEEPMDIDSQALAVTSLEQRKPKSVTDIDDHDELFLCPEFAQDIILYMKARENKVLLPPDFLAINPGVTSQMRGILMDWLIQVQAHEQLEEETLQLCVAITDQYLARKLVPLPQLQLVGVTALMIAAKYVERFPPLVETLCALTAGTYTDREVLETEKSILSVLQFDVGLPVPLFFLRRFITVHQDHVQVERLARYVLDLSLPSILLVSVPPSLLAASALYVARRVWMPEMPEAWSPGLAFYSGYRSEELASAVRVLAKMLLRADVSKYQAARQKHSDEKQYGAISVDPVLDNHPALIQLTYGSQVV